MNLKKYQKKRDFNQTLEPEGKRLKHLLKRPQKKLKLKFVVQKHFSKHLHYDFRLEVDGVLKSWAVPKGPSLDPKIKRLAIQVEDHPLKYASFEGTIPEGEYGAGEVTIWDRGIYEVVQKNKVDPGKWIREQLDKGELTFFLSGNKLKGKFTLIRLKNANKSNQWLLIKQNDNFQSKEEDSESLEHSRQKSDVLNLKNLPSFSLPKKITPMLATLINEPFDDKEWIFEIKWDGYRAIAEVSAKQINLYSRNQTLFNQKFPLIVSALQKFNADVIFDGEIVILDHNGIPQFQLLQNYLKGNRKHGLLRYCIFDILYYQGHDLTDLPLTQRKAILCNLLKAFPSPYLIYSDYVEEKGGNFFNECLKAGIEGIIAKKASSLYLSRRSKLWLKIKTHRRQEIVIGGYTAPRGSRKQLGALIGGVYKNDKLEFVGLIGAGFNKSSLIEIFDLIRPLKTTESPFASPPKISQSTWIKPELICEVSFQEWTKENKMRQPIFKGIRFDKSAKDVIKEETMKACPAKELNSSIPIHIKELVNHPQKVLWPKERITKLDLAEYYFKVASFLLPHLKDRPIVLHRFPDGIEGKDFFQKEAPKFIPKWIETATIQQSQKKISYILIQNLESLIYVINLGSIEIHPFLSKYQSIDYPDFMVIDLDPLDLPFEAVIEVAQGIHTILKDLSIEAFCKTSGKRGLHIYFSLHALYSYEIVENFAKLFAKFIQLRLPDITSLARNPNKRQQKVYIDYLQNGYSKTIVAPYSVRPLDDAPVATPLEWKEIKKGLDPRLFTIKTILPRLKKKGELLPLQTKEISIPSLLKKIENSFH